MVEIIPKIHKWNKDAGLITDNRELESSMLLEEVLEGLGIPNARTASRKLITDLKVQYPDRLDVTDVDWLDHLCDLEFILHGSKSKMGLTPEQDIESIQIVLDANVTKLGAPKDSFGKQLKPEGWTPPEPLLQEVLDARA